MVGILPDLLGRCSLGPREKYLSKESNCPSLSLPMTKVTQLPLVDTWSALLLFLFKVALLTTPTHPDTISQRFHFWSRKIPGELGSVPRSPSFWQGVFMKPNPFDLLMLVGFSVTKLSSQTPTTRILSGKYLFNVTKRTD